MRHALTGTYAPHLKGFHRPGPGAALGVMIVVLNLMDCGSARHRHCPSSPTTRHGGRLLIGNVTSGFLRRWRGIGDEPVAAGRSSALGTSGLRRSEPWVEGNAEKDASGDGALMGAPVGSTPKGSVGLGEGSAVINEACAQRTEGVQV
jgi:hypothetical protein